MHIASTTKMLDGRRMHIYKSGHRCNVCTGHMIHVTRTVPSVSHSFILSPGYIVPAAARCSAVVRGREQLPFTDLAMALGVSMQQSQGDVQVLFPLFAYYMR